MPSNVISDLILENPNDEKKMEDILYELQKIGVLIHNLKFKRNYDFNKET